MTPQNRGLLDNLLGIIGDRRWEQPKYASPSICSFDLFFLLCLAESLDAKKIVEFGCGSTTAELSDAGYNLTTFSLGKSKGASKLANVSYVECDITSQEMWAPIRNSLKEADLLLIDADHTSEFAKYYHENFLLDCSVPVWIHDYWVSREGCVPYTEQMYLDKSAIGKTHKKLTQTDLPPDAVKEISSRIGHNIAPQRRRVNFRANPGPKMCSVVLERLPCSF